MPSLRQIEKFKHDWREIKDMMKSRDATLKEVAAAPTFDLLEVQLARDILAGSSHRLTQSKLERAPEMEAA